MDGRLFGTVHHPFTSAFVFRDRNHSAWVLVLHLCPIMHNCHGIRREARVLRSRNHGGVLGSHSPFVLTVPPIQHPTIAASIETSVIEKNSLQTIVIIVLDASNVPRGPDSECVSKWPVPRKGE